MFDPNSDNSLAQAHRIDAWCDEFEASWQKGEPRSLEEILDQALPSDRDSLLRELLPIELHHRRQRGELVGAEEFARRFPWFNAESLGSVFASLTETLDVLDSTKGSSSPPTSETPVVPGFEILGELGRGAMGVVYQARQVKLGRIVALKMILTSGPEQVRRFRAEAVTIARLQHPNIVQIYDVGENGRHPYLALELVEGGTLAQKIADVPQSPRDAARLVETLARAIHQAHRAGIVHRDLKPANVLLTRDQEPKITDFGLAKQLAADHAATASGMLLGTPQYMAPEQAKGQASRIGPAADIYALGVILYELLTGRPPLQASNLHQLLRDICEREPVTPRSVKQSVPIDLETVCMKCLRKCPTERYTTAAELADDLQRYLCDEPILARPISGLARTWRWCRRNPWIAGPSFALAMLLVTVTVVAVVVTRRFEGVSKSAEQNEIVAKEASTLANQRAFETRLELGRSLVNEARMLRRSQRVGQFVNSMAKVKEARQVFLELEARGRMVDQEDWDELRDEAASALLVPDLLTQQRWPRKGAELPRYVATDAVHGRYVSIAANATHAEICRFGDDQPLDRIAAPNGASFHSAAFSDNGERLALTSIPDHQLHVWDLSGSPKLVRTVRAPHLVGSLTPDGSVVVTGVDTTTTLFQRVNDGASLAQTNLGIPPFGFPCHPFRPWVALTMHDKLRLFDFAENRMVWEVGYLPSIRNVAWSHDGRQLLASTDRSMLAFDGETGIQLLPPMLVDAAGVLPIPASQADVFASTDWSGSLRLFSAGTGRSLLKSESRFFDYPRCTGSESTLSMAYDQNDFQLLRIRQGRMKEFGLYATQHLALSHSGQLLAASLEPNKCKIFHLPSGAQVLDNTRFWGHMPLGFTADDRGLLLYGQGTLREIKLEHDSETPTRWQIDESSVKTHYYSSMRESWGMDRQGRVIAIPKYGLGASILHLPSNPSESIRTVSAGPQNDVRSAEVSPDGRWVALGSHVNGKVTVHSAGDGTLIAELLDEGGSAVFSPDGAWLAVRRFTGGAVLFQVESWKRHGDLPGSGIAFTRDGKLLVVDDGLSRLSLIDSMSLRTVGRLEIPDQVRVVAVAFTPDGRGLIARTEEAGRLLYVDLCGVRRDLRELGLDWKCDAIPFEPAPIGPTPKIDVTNLVDSPTRRKSTNFNSETQVLARDRRWELVVPKLEDACLGRPANFDSFFQLAILYAYLDDEPSYVRVANQMFQHFGSSKEPWVLERLALVLALSKNGEFLGQSPVELPQIVLYENPVIRGHGMHHLIAGLVEWRSGQKAKAKRHLAEAVRDAGPNLDFKVMEHFVTSLVELAENRRDQAIEEYAAGIDLMWHQSPHSPSQLSPTLWYERLLTEWMCRQVEIQLWQKERSQDEHEVFLRSRVSPAPPPELVYPAPNSKLKVIMSREVAYSRRIPFQWKPVEGAESYHFAFEPESTIAGRQEARFNKVDVAGPRLDLCDPPFGGQSGVWKVRAKVDGRWTNWSEARNLMMPPSSGQIADLKTESLATAAWSPDGALGLELVAPDEGAFELLLDGGIRIVQSKSRYLYFRVADTFAWELPVDESDEFWLEVFFRHTSATMDHHEAIRVQYDSHPILVRQDNAYSTSPNAQYPLIPEFRKCVFELPQARFANRQHGEADFRISVPAGIRLNVQKVTLHRSPARGAAVK
ncbi:MAG: WD40 repeat domain-containing serine/threonine protein kinase [Pirellulales bacterium]